GGDNPFAGIGDPNDTGPGTSVKNASGVNVPAPHPREPIPTLTLPSSVEDKIGDPPELGLTSLAISASGSKGTAGIAGSVGLNIYETPKNASVDAADILNARSRAVTAPAPTPS